MNLANAVDGAKPEKRKVPLAARIAIAVGGLILAAAAAFMAVVMIRNYIRSNIPINGVSGPSLTIGGKVYETDDGFYMDSMPDKYLVIGEVLTEGIYTNDEIEGHATWFRIGEKVYQNPADTSEVYINSKSVVNDGNYHYVRLTDYYWQRRQSTSESGGEV